MSMKQILQNLLHARLDAAGWAWLEKAMQACLPPLHDNTLLGYYAGASRRAGKKALLLTEEESAQINELASSLALPHWGVDEVVRAFLLLSLDHLAPDEYFRVVQLCYDKGDSREQESWLRGLMLLPDAERFLETAIDACRTNIIPLFEAIACENPFPSLYFPELNFNQLAMKSLFYSLPLARIVGLENRLNPSLSKICADYVSEREAAGREVPPDIWFALTPHMPEQEMPRVQRYLEHENAEHRYWAARGLGLLKTKASHEVLKARGNSESDDRVKSAIEKSLSILR